jgi:hypothetical protein
MSQKGIRKDHAGPGRVLGHTDRERDSYKVKPKKDRACHSITLDVTWLVHMAFTIHHPVLILLLAV